MVHTHRRRWDWARAQCLCTSDTVRSTYQCCGGRAEAKSNLCTDSVCILLPVAPANSLRPLRARGLEPVIPSSSKASSLRPVPCSRPHHQSPAVLLKKHSLSTYPLKSSQDKHSPARAGSAQRCLGVGGREHWGVWVACFGLIRGLGKIPVLFTTSCWE